MKICSITVTTLCLALACARTVDLRINGRTSEYLKAEIAEAGGVWLVTAELPAGTWRAALRGEDATVTVAPAGSRSTASWRVAPERLRQERPFILELRAADAADAQVVLELRPQRAGQGFMGGLLQVVYEVVRPIVR